MRIAEINMLHIGSTGKIMLGIATCAREIGHEVRTFSPHIYQVSGVMEEPTIDGHSYFGMRLENMFHLRLAQLTGYHGCFSWLGTQQLLRMLDEFRPDVIHLHNLHNCTINLPMLFGYIKKHHIRTIWTLHDCWSFTGQCPYFTIVDCEKWKTGCHRCPQINVYPKSYVDQTKRMWKKKRAWFTGVENMTIVTPSRWLADLAKQSYLKDYPIQVIHNGINTDTFSPRGSDFRVKHGLGNKYMVLGVSFGWGHRKGLDVMKELACRLPEDYLVVLVGTNEEMDQELPKNILSIHRTNNQQELAQIYASADVFAMPTREENYPTVNMEALACGTPVITFRTGGSPEMLDETCGMVVPCDDIDAMEAGIRKICEERPFSPEACTAHAAAFDQRTCFQEYVELYEQ